MFLPAEVSSATQKSCRRSGSYAPVRTRARDRHRRPSIIVFTGFGFAIISLNSTKGVVLIEYCKLGMGNDGMNIEAGNCKRRWL